MVNKHNYYYEENKRMKIYHTVLMPIEVPLGEYCWNRTVCPHFDNEGGHPTCKYDLGDLKYDARLGFVRKPKRCLELKDSE